MEQLLFNDFSPQFKHLFDGAGLPNPLQMKSSQNKKSKLNDDDGLDLSAAYLGPQIWNEMMVADDLKLDSVDLDKLLLESVSTDLENEVLNDLTRISADSPSSIAPTHSSPVVRETPSDIFLYSSPKPTQTPYSPVPPNFTFDAAVTTSISPNLQHQSSVVESAPLKPVEAPKEPGSPLPATLSYQPSIADVMISTPTNGLDEPSELFDPSKRAFSDEELKPQPIIRKARKSYVASDCKDTKYWQKREKNNMAAKRSREARRIKENQIAMRANFLEKENNSLRQEVQQLRKELVRLMKVVKSQD